MRIIRRLGAAVSITPAALFASVHMAAAQMPQPWEIGMQPAHSPVKEGIHDLNVLVTVIISAIVVLVAALLLWVAYRFDSRRNPTPSRISHNTPLEIAWTVVPVLILVVIAIPSFRLVYFEDRTDHPDMTVKVTGHQWYWEYGYPDADNMHFNSYIVQDADLKPGQPRLLTADTQLVLPVGKNIRILTTSGDVIHSFFIPSLGVQRYAIPGRVIETWVKIDKPGDYYGECNQICGTNHSQMPIDVHAVTEADYETWLKQAKAKYNADAGTSQDASAAPPDVEHLASVSAEIRR
jgi:cytochrome c oxidase subunit 2